MFTVMSTDQLENRIEDLLNEKNYLAACLLLKNSSAEGEESYDISGKVVARILDDLSAEKNKEKSLFLRSLLIWVFRDLPGLSSIYREQLRSASGTAGPFGDIWKNLRMFSDVMSGEKSASSVAEDAAENIKQHVKDAADNLNADTFTEKVKDFFSSSGIDLDDGLKRATDFFESLNPNARPGARDATPPKDKDGD